MIPLNFVISCSAVVLAVVILSIAFDVMARMGW